MAQILAVQHLELAQLTCKCVMLTALTSGQRVQTLRRMHLDCMTFTREAFCFTYPLVWNRPTPEIYLPRSPHPCTCVWVWICDYFMYLLRTETLRASDRLFVITTKEHSSATWLTLGRWLREVLELAGVNSKIYKAHSTRSALTSKAQKYVSTDKVLAAADWKGPCILLHTVLQEKCVCLCPGSLALKWSSCTLCLGVLRLVVVEMICEIRGEF